VPFASSGRRRRKEGGRRHKANMETNKFSIFKTDTREDTRKMRVAVVVVVVDSSFK